MQHTVQEAWSVYCLSHGGATTDVIAEWFVDDFRCCTNDCGNSTRGQESQTLFNLVQLVRSKFQ